MRNFNPNNVYAGKAIDVFEFADVKTLTYDELLARGFDEQGTESWDTITGINITDRIYGLGGADQISDGYLDCETNN